MATFGGSVADPENFSKFRILLESDLTLVFLFLLKLTKDFYSKIIFYKNRIYIAICHVTHFFLCKKRSFLLDLGVIFSFFLMILDDVLLFKDPDPGG